MRKHRDLVTTNPDILVHATYAQQANGCIKVRGYPINAKTGIKIDGFGGPIIRTAKTTFEIPVIEQQLIVAVMDKVRKPTVPKSNAQIRHELTQLERAITDLLKSGTQMYPGRWGETTQRKALTHYRSKIIPFLQEMLARGHEIIMSDIAELRNALIDQVLKHGRSNGDRAKAEQTINSAMYQDNMVHQYLINNYPELNLPDIQLSTGQRVRTYQPEQVKMLPRATRRTFVEALKKRTKEEPTYVMGAVLMLDGGLRTAEACAIWTDVIDWYDDYAVVIVKWQIKDGVRSEMLKRPASYRQVVVSYWGRTMLEACIEQIEENGLQITATAPIAIPEDLSRWIRLRLCDSGLTDDFIDAVRELQRIAPDPDDDGNEIDVMAYILRRDRASRWRSICGLTSDAIDYMIGHERKTPTTDQTDYKLPSEQGQISRALERDVYDKVVTRNPYYYPLGCSPDADIDLVPYQAYKLCNRADEPLYLDLEVVAAECGTEGTLEVPAGCVKDINVHDALDRYPPKTVIGLDCWEVVYEKETGQSDNNCPTGCQNDGG